MFGLFNLYVEEVKKSLDCHLSIFINFNFFFYFSTYFIHPFFSSLFSFPFIFPSKFLEPIFSSVSCVVGMFKFIFVDQRIKACGYEP